jgi:hypothetical protein
MTTPEYSGLVMHSTRVVKASLVLESYNRLKIISLTFCPEGPFTKLKLKKLRKKGLFKISLFINLVGLVNKQHSTRSGLELLNDY